MRRLVFLFLPALIAAACGRPAAAPPDEGGAGDAGLQKVLTAYAVEFLRRNPTTNTYLGGAGLDPSLDEADGRLRDHSAAAIEQEDRWLAGVQTEIQGIDATTLSADGRIDREVALAQIRFMLRQHQQRRYQERALDTYVAEPFRALDWQLQGMTQTGSATYGSPAEWRLVIRRLQAVPRFLDVAQEQLRAGLEANRVPDRRMLVRDGINSAEANARYFGDTLPRLAADRIAGAERDRLLDDLRAASKEAAGAYLKFRDFVAATFFESRDARQVRPSFAGDRFAMGEDEYNWAIGNNFRLMTTAAQLYAEAWPIVEATQREMIDLARELGRRRSWTLPEDGRAAVRAVFDELSKEYPRSDAEMIAWYREAAFRLVEYGRKTGMFDIPADYKLDVTETPPPLQASIDGAAYYPAPPFKATGVGRFYVTPTHDDPAALRSNNRASLADLAAHEGFPGHDWYFKVLTEFRTRVSPVRWLTPGAVEDSSSMWEDSMSAEGWGLYAEALMRSRSRARQRGSTLPKRGCTSCRASCTATFACGSTPGSTPAGCGTTRP